MKQCSSVLYVYMYIILLAKITDYKKFCFVAAEALYGRAALPIRGAHLNVFPTN